MKNIIKCPNCDWEYLPGEIFIPSNLIGQPREVERTIEGKIDTYYGVQADNAESFTCDHCGCKMKIIADINYIITKDTELDFNEDFISNKYPSDRLTLFEG